MAVTLLEAFFSFGFAVMRPDRPIPDHGEPVGATGRIRT